MRTLLTALLLAVGAGGASALAVAGENPAERIAAASRAFSAAYVAGDTTALGELYTADALLLPPGRRVRGRAAIRRYFAPHPGRENLTHVLTGEDLEVRGGTAVDVGTWHDRWRRDGAEREASGSYLVVWRRGADGAWRMAYDMWHRPGE